MLKSFNILLTTAIICFVTIFMSCADNVGNQTGKDVIIKQEKAKLEEANRYLVQQEKGIIDNYISTTNAEFETTGTGLRYRVIEQGDSELIKTGDIITMEYEVRLINGELMYSSDNDGLKVFQVGRGGVERGLEEVVLRLHYDDRAEVIIPSYLAHGLTGDGNRIPPRSILVYNLKIIDKQ